MPRLVTAQSPRRFAYIVRSRNPGRPTRACGDSVLDAENRISSSIVLTQRSPSGAGFDAGDEAEIGDANDAPRDQPVEPFGGAGPEVAVAILHERHHAVARQPGQLDRALDRVVRPAAADAPEPLAERADPQVVVAVAEDRVTAAAPQRIAGGGRRVVERTEADDRIGDVQARRRRLR